MAIRITGKFKPKGDFPLMDAADVEMANGTSVEAAFAQAVQLLNEVVIPKLLPVVSEGDNNKILQVVEGKWVAEEVFIPISQADYDALVAAGTVDESKYYMIVG